MKSSLKFLFAALVMIPLIAQGQFTTKTTPQVKTTPALKATDLKPNLIQANKLPKLEQPQILKESDISKFPIITFSPEELERSRQKSWEISPRKPFDTGVSIIHWGTLTETQFLMTPVIRYVVNTEYNYQAYSMRVLANLQQGKDYKLVLNVEQKSFPANSTVGFKVGTSEFRMEWPKDKNEIIILFNNTFTGQQVIDITPVQVSGRRESIDSKLEFAIKSIRLEELK
ncbi:hypothetical protein LZF95_24185 [Algoriphagus sp. AGSA1]|uniref:hypothetical protein n=1 Tax=Algoriphagus sp. AGSA1 TaxID=2907213 RepID=UPI001F22E037|nr:hypothetical protein [Algoriphagus sp. AGSA1]MCE7057804.1 hypothetical protein [Algoriphagus sp. AGSA1]